MALVTPLEVRNANVVTCDAPSASRSLITDERDMGRREFDPDTMWPALTVVRVVPTRDRIVDMCVNFIVELDSVKYQLIVEWIGKCMSNMSICIAVSVWSTSV